MKSVFSTLAGAFVVDNKPKIIDFVAFDDLEAYDKRDDVVQKLVKKHDASVGDAGQYLSLLKDKKYFLFFRKQHLLLSVSLIRESVNDGLLVMNAVRAADDLDKVANVLVKRLREWVGAHVPELSHFIDDHAVFLRLFAEKSKKELLKEFNVVESMGADLTVADVNEMKSLGTEVERLYALRENHLKYVEKVMKRYCPNVLALCGVGVGGKLLVLAGGLKRLAMLPSSTVQLLGAEKALFRHLTRKAKSPKHGVILNHPIVQGAREKGKAARGLAEKISLCARLDYFKGEFKGDKMRMELEGKFAN
jgi:nucleolar protein 56